MVAHFEPTAIAWLSTMQEFLLDGVRNHRGSAGYNDRAYCKAEKPKEYLGRSLARSVWSAKRVVFAKS